MFYLHLLKIYSLELKHTKRRKDITMKTKMQNTIENDFGIPLLPVIEGKELTLIQMHRKFPKQLERTITVISR